MIKESLLDSILLTCDLERLWVSEAAGVAGEEALVDVRDLWIFFLLQKKKEECKLKLDFIWTGDGVSYSRFSGNLCTFCGWRVTFVRVGCGAVVHETIHVFKRDLGRGTQHLGEGSEIFEYLCIFHFCLQVVVRLKTHLGPWANERIARPIIFIWTILPTKAWVQFWGGSRFTRNMLKGKTRLLLSEAVNSICYKYYRCVDTNILGPHWHKRWQAWTEQMLKGRRDVCAILQWKVKDKRTNRNKSRHQLFLIKFCLKCHLEVVLGELYAVDEISKETRKKPHPRPSPRPRRGAELLRLDPVRNLILPLRD